MRRVDLSQTDHDVKVGKTCEYLEPNITEDSLFYLDDELIGFYIRNVNNYSENLTKYLKIADQEFKTDNVPKSTMKRASGLHDSESEVLQYSTILGSVAPRHHMRRPYATISSVHRIKSARTFIKGMMLACLEGQKIMQEVAPLLYEKQKELFDVVQSKWKFGGMFTSTISNYNIAAPYHIDNANIVGSVNMIMTKRSNSKGGCLTIPDFNITIESCDNSMIVYPAWKSIHGVTPIIPLTKDGYRNSHIFYPLKAFLNEHI
tara:strand:+ start:7144 stop:7926 length:783 start_codon:yes stop_codon:yes gene_type:complete